MSDLKKLLRDEAEQAEQNKDATPGNEAKINRPGRDRAKILSVRLNTKEYERLAAQAELAGVGPSTIARSMILRALNASGDSSPSDQWMASIAERLTTLEARADANT